MASRFTAYIERMNNAFGERGLKMTEGTKNVIIKVNDETKFTGEIATLAPSQLREQVRNIARELPELEVEDTGEVGTVPGQ